jgi:hypothetical protein
MAVTKIERTATVRPDVTVTPGYSWNPWRGCTKVSPGCRNCHAETMTARNPDFLGVWGPNGTSVVTIEPYWWQPEKWNQAAAEVGEPLVKQLGRSLALIDRKGGDMDEWAAAHRRCGRDLY